MTIGAVGAIRRAKSNLIKAVSEKIDQRANRWCSRYSIRVRSASLIGLFRCQARPLRLVQWLAQW